MNAIVMLEVMWDWRNVTSSAGYKSEAPRFFRINPNNHSGRRLHKWLTPQYEFLATNACPELVSSAKGRGTPSREWVKQNLTQIAVRRIDLMLVCGKVAQATYDHKDLPDARIIEIPHPAARFWTSQGIDLVTWEIATGHSDVRIDKGPDGIFTTQILR